MCAVYRAFDLRDDRHPVAVKVPRQALARRHEFSRAFVAVAENGTRLFDDHIARVVRHSKIGEPLLYLVMDEAPGGSLRGLLDWAGGQQRRLHLLETLHIAAQVARGLSRAHQMGTLHGGLKPENVLLTVVEAEASAVRARVADFRMTEPLAVIGEQPLDPRLAYAYSAPEALPGGGRADARADIYAFGALLYELLTQRRVFDPRGLDDARRMHRDEPPASPSHQRPGLPAEVEALVLRCLAKAPDDRYPDAETLRAELDGLIARFSTDPQQLSPEVNARARRISRYVGELLGREILPLDGGIPDPVEPVDPRAAQIDTAAEGERAELSVTVTPTHTMLKPGETRALRVVLRKQNALNEETLRLDLRGLPRLDAEAGPRAQWITVTPDTLSLKGNLPPGNEAEAELRLHPPKHTSSAAGLHHCTLRVFSETQGLEVALVRFAVRLEPYFDLRATLRPDRLYNTTQAALTIVNAGNSEVECELLTRDMDDNRGLVIALEREVLTIAPGREAQVGVRVTPTERARVHGARPVSFEIMVRAGPVEQIVAGEVIVMTDLLGLRPRAVPPIPAGAVPPHPPGVRTRFPYEALPSTDGLEDGLSGYLPPYGVGDAAPIVAPPPPTRRPPELLALLAVYALGLIAVAALAAAAMLAFLIGPPPRPEAARLFVLLWGCAVLSVLGGGLLLAGVLGWRRWAVHALMVLSFPLLPVGPLLTLGWSWVLRDYGDAFQ